MTISKDHSSQTHLINFIRENSSLSRRNVSHKIKCGHVSVNKHIIYDLTYPVTSRDLVLVDNIKINKTQWLYYKFHKPIGTISTFKDPKQRKDLNWHLTRFKLEPSLRPCGRLDRDSSGLLIFSNDGTFMNHILHPKFSIEKYYELAIDRPLHPLDKKTLSTGFFLNDGPTKIDIVSQSSSTIFTVKISMGRNRILRRTFSSLGYTITTLHRISIGPIALDALAPGTFEKIPPSTIKTLVLNLRN